jgi:hypothetical protein
MCTFVMLTVCTSVKIKIPLFQEMYFDSSVHFNVTRTINKNFIFETEGPFKATVCKAQHWDTQHGK